jgi:hypothetical protein
LVNKDCPRGGFFSLRDFEQTGKKPEHFCILREHSGQNPALIVIKVINRKIGSISKDISFHRMAMKVKKQGEIILKLSF